MINWYHNVFKQVTQLFTPCHVKQYGYYVFKPNVTCKCKQEEQMLRLQIPAKPFRYQGKHIKVTETEQAITNAKSARFHCD